MSLWSAASTVVDSSPPSIWGRVGPSLQPKVSSNVWDSRANSFFNSRNDERLIVPESYSQRDIRSCSPVTSLGIGTADSVRKDESWFVHHAQPAQSLSVGANHHSTADEDIMQLNELTASFWNLQTRPADTGPSLVMLRNEYTTILTKMEEVSIRYESLKREKDRILNLLVKNSAPKTSSRFDLLSLENTFDFDSPVPSTRGANTSPQIFTHLPASVFSTDGDSIDQKECIHTQFNSLEQRKITPIRFNFTPEKSMPFRSKNNQDSAEPCELDILKAPPTSFNFGQVCTLSREDLLARLDEADQCNQRRLFLPGRGWISKKKLEAELRPRKRGQRIYKDPSLRSTISFPTH